MAKAAHLLGDDAFWRMQDRLFEAYFAENRDITDPLTLRELWREAELPAAEFARSEDPALLQETLREHREAQESGATGVPAMQLVGNDAMIVGAHPLELYRRWVDRTLAEHAAEATV